MSKTFRNDLTGQRFGRLIVLEFVPTDDRKAYWRCRCDCGNVKTVPGDDLKNGHTSSCGCLSSRHTIGEHNKTHGKTNTRIYKIWAGMKQRCYYSKHREYFRYGGRGITVCDEWRNDFMSFYNWAMANGYSDELSIDRIDVNKNYCPKNCRWITMKEQQRNRRNTVIVSYKGQEMSLADAAERSGISTAGLYYRYQRGDREERLFRPVEK